MLNRIDHIITPNCLVCKFNQKKEIESCWTLMHPFPRSGMSFQPSVLFVPHSSIQAFHGLSSVCPFSPFFSKQTTFPKQGQISPETTKLYTLKSSSNSQVVVVQIPTRGNNGMRTPIGNTRKYERPYRRYLRTSIPGTMMAIADIP